MFRAALALTMGIIIGAPVMAQDTLDQYLAAEQSFLPTGLMRDPVEQRLAMERILQDIEGRWMEASLVMAEVDRSAEDVRGQMEDWIERACSANPSVLLTAPTPYSFAMTRTATRRDTTYSLTVTYSLSAANLFNKHVDEAEYLDYTGLRDPETGELRSFALQSLVGIAPSFFGPVALFHPSNDILVLQEVPGRTQIFARCP